MRKVTGKRTSSSWRYSKEDVCVQNAKVFLMLHQEGFQSPDYLLSVCLAIISDIPSYLSLGPWSKYCYHYFTHAETEAQGVLVTIGGLRVV